uniref:FH2 domain-containing protein n=1 Tax=Knipowitschia caucasica TaxID=637954 RepID=A0AAV2KAY1_KNICA
MQEYGHIYIEASSHTESHEDLLDSDEALQRLEEEWPQEMEPSLCLSHPSRPQHVDFLHLTALEEEDISPVPSPLPPLIHGLESFFTPKPLKIDSSEKVDLEAVRRRIRSEREQLKTFFEKTDVSTEEETNGKSDDAEDKTPGRLQAVWPPLQEEEKVGLKYTEAEHQASLLQLKRQCNEDLEKLQEDYAEELSRLKEESDDCVSRLQFTIIELQSRLSQSVSRRHGEVRDASVSTSDETKTFRNAGIQTDCELMKPSHNEDGGHDSDLRFISENWSEQNNNPGFSDHRSFTCQTHPIIDPVSRVSQCHHSNVPPPPPGPPPPPPPLPESGFCPLSLSLDTAPRKPFVEPSRPMKPLYWARIQLQQNNEQTVWSSLEEAKINTCDFEDLFCKTATQTKRKPLSEVYGRKTKTKKIVKLLDQKRSQAVGILISSLHLDMKDIERAVLTVDPSVVDVDTIEALYENKAQPDELGKIKQHYETSNEEDVKLLDKPEQFLYELSQISDFAGRAQCIIFQSSFLDGIVSIRHKLRTVSSVCEELSQRQSVKQVMGLVLALGNHMNGGSRTRGQADGFGLDILPKLKDVKSRDNRINLGDYLVSYYLQNVDKNAGTDRSVFPLPEPQDVFLAAQVKFEELHKDLRQLSHDLTQCEKNIQNVCSNSPEEHLQPFKDKMEAFVLSARKEHGEASYQLLTIEKSFQDLVAYFGLQAKAGDKEVTPGYFFMLWFEFCSDFKVRWKRESKNVSKERLKEAQLSVKRITGEKKVETRKTNANSLKERLRQKEATLSST